jgi:hypothetical protein
MNGTLFVIAATSVAAMVAEPAPLHGAHAHGARTLPPTASTPAQSLSAPAERTSYRRFNANEPMLDWRAANDRVAQIGGWRAYAKEAAASSAKATEATQRPQSKSEGGRP